MAAAMDDASTREDGNHGTESDYEYEYDDTETEVSSTSQPTRYHGHNPHQGRHTLISLLDLLRRPRPVLSKWSDEADVQSPKIVGASPAKDR